MASPAERLIDEAILHRIALSRYSTWSVQRVLSVLNRTDENLVARIRHADEEGRSSARLEHLLNEVRALQADGWTVVRSRLGDDLAALARAERDFSARMVRYGQQAAGMVGATGVPTTAQVVAAATARPFQGRFLQDWLREAEDGAAKRAREVIRQGFIEGRSAADVARTLRGTRANQYRDGVLEVSRRGAEAMVRTANSHYASVAARETYLAMGVARVRFIATLDTRTTITCASLHNTVHELERFPWPPRHINCRSTSAPEIEGLRSVEVPSYDQWLKRQPVEIQDLVLGRAKGRLYRSGNLTVDRFVDDKGRLLTLDQLRTLSGLAPLVRVLSPIGPVASEELAALTSYTGSGYRSINGALRGVTPFTPEVRDEIDALDQLIGRARLPEETTLYRGVGPNMIERFRAEGLRAGSVITDPAFMSTSLSMGAARQFQSEQEGAYFIRILAPAGGRGLNVERVSSFGEEEREVLFARGQRLKVVSYDHATRTITARILAYRL